MILNIAQIQLKKGLDFSSDHMALLDCFNCSNVSTIQACIQLGLQILNGLELRERKRSAT